MDQAIACLDFIWDESRITDRLVNVCLIEEEVARNPIDISDDELQAAMDAFRRGHKLYKAEDTRRWMERRGVTHQEFEHVATSQAILAKLKDKIAGQRVEEYFASHGSGFDTAYVEQLGVSDQAAAGRLAARIRRGTLDFATAARTLFVAAKQERNEVPQFFGAIQRREAPQEIRAALFDATPGSIVGPVFQGNHYVLFHVVDIVQAELNDSTRDAIKQTLFQEWLEERRQAANIEWLWGNARKTSAASQKAK
jgi:putative peptide maturation system protein